MSCRLLDWAPLGLDSDPVPGDTSVLVGIEQGFRRMSDGAREVNAGLDALLLGAEKGGFEGATAEALREDISDRLKRFIANVAASFDIAASAVFRYRTAVQQAQQMTSAALDAASASSASIAMKALSFGCHCAIRSRQDCVTSREDTRLSAIAFATAVSDIRAGAVLTATPLHFA